MTARTPTHIVRPGTNAALCGERDPLPRVAQAFAHLHRYPQARCAACYTAAELAWMLAPPYILTPQPALGPTLFDGWGS